MKIKRDRSTRDGYEPRLLRSTEGRSLLVDRDITARMNDKYVSANRECLTGRNPECKPCSDDMYPKYVRDGSRGIMAHVRFGS